MNCPSCNQLLTRKKYAEINLFGCPQCRGHLVEHHRVKTIERRVGKDLKALVSEISAVDGTDTVEEIRCPRCRDRMRKTEVKAPRNFQVDRCRNCDLVWLDGGELAEIQLAFGASAQTVELDRMRARLAAMTPAERNEYETRIANLMEVGTELEIMTAVADELALQFYLQQLRPDRN